MPKRAGILKAYWLKELHSTLPKDSENISEGEAEKRDEPHPDRGTSDGCWAAQAPVDGPTPKHLLAAVIELRGLEKQKTEHS